MTSVGDVRAGETGPDDPDADGWNADERWDDDEWTDEAADEEPASGGGGRSLLRASAMPAVGTALSRVSGLVRVAALTSALGLTSVADVYNLANTAPNILYELVIGGVLSSTLVPLFIHAQDDPEDESTSVMVTVGFVAITALTLLAVLAAPLLNRLFAMSVDGPERAHQIAIGDDFLLLLLPQIFFYGMTTLATALLHARRKFAAPAFAPVLTNVVISIAALIVYRFIDPAQGDSSMNTVYVLGLGTTAGVAAMAIALLPAIRRAGIVLRWDFRPRHPAVRSVIRLSGWTVGFAIANQVSLLIVLTLARGAGVGAVSAYQYAFIFFQLPYGLIAVSIMTAVLPELATAARNGDDQMYIAKFREGLSLLLTFMVPAAGAYLFLGTPLIEILLQRGEFDAAATEETARMLLGFSVGLPAFAIFLYCVRAFHARRNTRTPFYLNVFENVLNVVLVVPLVAVLETTGLAMAYSVAYWAAAALALFVLQRQVRGLIGWATADVALRALVLGAAVLVAIGLAEQRLVGTSGAVAEVAICVAVALPVFAVATLLIRPMGFEPIIDRLDPRARRRGSRAG